MTEAFKPAIARSLKRIVLPDGGTIELANLKQQPREPRIIPGEIDNHHKRGYVIGGPNDTMCNPPKDS